VLGGRFAECDEEVGEVVAEVAGVCAAEHCLDVDGSMRVSVATYTGFIWIE
jgi:hypothetical protein